MVAPLLTLLCLLWVCGLLVAEWHGHARGKGVCKLAASLSFILLGLALGADTSGYGRWLLAGLVLSALGDGLLLSGRSGFFMAGLGAFLLAHLAYAAAFGRGELPPAAIGAAFVGMAAVGGLTLRWLWPALSNAFRWAVGAYVLAIGSMVVLAVGRSAASGVWWLAAGAVVFAASDVAVARERFVAPGFVNRAWGLPLYYAAQLVLAWTLAQPVLTA